MSQGAEKTTQDGPKTPKGPPKAPKMTPKGSKNDPDMTPKTQKMRHLGPQKEPHGPQEAPKISNEKFHPGVVRFFARSSDRASDAGPGWWDAPWRIEYSNYL